MPPQATYGSLPFPEAIEHLKAKVNLPTEHWDDIVGAAHDQYFVVAGAAKADLLADLHEAVRKGIEDGTTLEEFRRDFDRAVFKSGWTGFTGEDTPGGLAWRTQTIYATNLRTAYQAGRHAQHEEGKAERPYLQYHHADGVETPRPLHLKWDGLILEIDNPWVKTHYTPNGWGCRCYWTSLAPRDLARLGKVGPDDAPDDGTYVHKDRNGVPHTIPKGIDYGWDHTPGATRDLIAEVKAKPRPAGIARDLEEDLRGVRPRARSVAGDPAGPRPLIRLDAMDTDTVDGVREVLVSFAAQNAEGWLPHGVRRVVAADIGEATIAATDHRGYFALGTAPLAAASGRSGRELITGALDAIKRGLPLDFHQEYGIESLWHEILHNSQRHPEPPGARIDDIRLVEGLHQTLARQTYPALLSALGRDPAHLIAVRREGLSYPKAAGRFQRVLQRLGLQGDDYLIDPAARDALLALLRETPYDVMRVRLRDQLSSLSGAASAQIDEMLYKIQAGQDPTP